VGQTFCEQLPTLYHSIVVDIFLNMEGRYRQARGPSVVCFAAWFFMGKACGPTNSPSPAKAQEDLSKVLQLDPKSRIAYARDKVLDSLGEVVDRVKMFNMHKRMAEDEGHGKSNKHKKHKVSSRFSF
jgi:hypothetical protein